MEKRNKSVIGNRRSGERPSSPSKKAPSRPSGRSGNSRPSQSQGSRSNSSRPSRPPQRIDERRRSSNDTLPKKRRKKRRFFKKALILLLVLLIDPQRYRSAGHRWRGVPGLRLLRNPRRRSGHRAPFYRQPVRGWLLSAPQ